MIDKKSVIIGLIVSIVLVLSLGLYKYQLDIHWSPCWSIIASYLANKKNQLKVVESALHGILVGIFTGVVQILIIYT